MTSHNPESRFGYDQNVTLANQRLFIETPTWVIDRISNHPVAGKRLLHQVSKKVRTIDIDRGEVYSRLLVNTKKIGAMPSHHQQRQTLFAVEQVLSDVQAHAHDPLLKADLGIGSTATGRSSLQMEVSWPELPEDRLSALATTVMRDTAQKLRYVAPRYLDDLVYAQVSRGGRVTLQANERVGCVGSTYGGYHQDAAPTFELSADNLNHPAQQLICLAGAVAIAHATELLAPASE